MKNPSLNFGTLLLFFIVCKVNGRLASGQPAAPQPTPQLKNTVFVAFAQKIDSPTTFEDGKPEYWSHVSQDTTLAAVRPHRAPPASLAANGLAYFSGLDSASFESTDLRQIPIWICFGGTKNNLYVSSWGQDQGIQVVDCEVGARVDIEIPIQGVITNLSTSSNGQTVLACTIGIKNSVELISTKNNAAGKSIPCERPPLAAAMQNDRVYIAENLSRARGFLNIFAADGGSPVTKIPIGAVPTAIALTNDSRTLLAVNSGADSISFVDCVALVEKFRLPVGKNPIKIAFSPDSKTAFVTNRGSNTVTVIDILKRSVKATWPVDQGPISVALNREGDRVYVGCKDSGTLLVLDARDGKTLERLNFAENSCPWGIAIHP